MRPGVTIETIGPCPFCGSNRAALCEIGPKETGPRVWVECPACDATGPVCGGHEEDGDRSDVAIDLWNNAPRLVIHGTTQISEIIREADRRMGPTRVL